MVTSVYITATPVYKKIQELQSPTARVVLEDEMRKLGEIGEKAARLKIKTDNTPFGQVKAQTGLGSSGRVRSGKMLASVGSRLEIGPKQMRMRVGWPVYEDYFGLQEEGGWRQRWKFSFKARNGFTRGPNAPSGFVFRLRKGPAPKARGMFAMQDAKLAMLQAKPAMIKKIKQMYGLRFNS